MRGIDDRVTCEGCVKALLQCPTNERWFPLAGEVFKVGNVATPDMGHAMYDTPTGRVALCSAERWASTQRRDT